MQPHNARWIRFSRATVAVAMLALCFGGLTFAASNAKRIDALLSSYHDLQQFNGAALVAEDGEIVFEHGYGLANIEWNVPNTPDTKFRLGSITKQFTHGGGINGFNTVILRVIEDRNLVVLLNNTGGTRLRDITDGILDVLYGRTPPEPKRPISDVVREILGKSGIEAAIARYRVLRKEQPDAYDFGEGELNLLGYQLMTDGDLEGALAIFRLNVEMFPDQSNPYDSLGEALAANGETEAAIKNYARSLELNPRNRNAVVALQRLIDE